MKPTLTKFRLLALSLFVAASIAVNAQEDAKAKLKAESDKRATTELILGLPKISDKTLFIISETTLKINGLVFVSFCDGHKLASFRYDKELFEKPEDVIKAFEKENVFMPMLVKQGSFKEVEEMCSTN